MARSKGRLSVENMTTDGLYMRLWENLIICEMALQGTGEGRLGRAASAEALVITRELRQRSRQTQLGELSEGF